MSGSLLLPLNETRHEAIDDDAAVKCMDLCFRCAAVCESCADACMTDPVLARLATTLRSQLSTAGVCRATARALGRRGTQAEDLAMAQVSACIEVCELSAAACDRYAMGHRLCRVCAAACRECREACEGLLAY